MASNGKEHPHVRALLEAALSYPEAHETSPWGHRVIKVRTKSFVFFGGEEGVISISVKLPQSGDAALSLPVAEPTGYGLGKSGWVSARFPTGEALPFSILRAWIDESYRAIAPKTLVAKLDGAAPRATSKAKRQSDDKAGARTKRAAPSSAPSGSPEIEPPSATKPKRRSARSKGG